MTAKGWAYVALGVGVAAISWSAILIREAEAPFLVIGAYRMVLAGAPMGALALVQQRRAPQRLSLPTLALLVLSAAFLAGHFAFWIASLERTSVATSVVLVAAQPLYVALIAPFVLGERLNRGTWIALSIAMTGVVIMAGEDFADGLGTLLGDAYAMLGGVFAAGYFVVGRRVRPHVPWLQYVGIVYPITAVLLVAAALIAGDAFTGYSTKTYLMIALLAAGPQLIGHSSINWSLAILPAIVVSIAILLEPLGTTALAIVILDETPSLFELLGGTLVIAGVYMALRPQGAQRLEGEVTSAD